MNYARALRTLQDRREARVRLGLGRMRAHLKALGRPERAYACVHVAGTNAKGSVCAMLASVLREAGRRTGLYTSPHLDSPRERISVDGRDIPPAAFARLLARALRAEPPGGLSYFELLTSVAFQYFRERGVEIAVLETGLGGRLDATNVVERPLATLVTTIDFDHMDYLGKTLASIAREKGGIFKRGSPALTAETKPEALRALRLAARRAGTTLKVLPTRAAWRRASSDWARNRQTIAGPAGRRLTFPLLGGSQARNAALVVEASAALRAAGWTIPAAAEGRGLRRARWPGRFEVLRRGPRIVILDGAHNPAAVREFLRTLRASPWAREPKLFILGALRDKDWREMTRLLAPELFLVAVARPPSPRALEPGELAAAVRRAAPRAGVSVFHDPAEAVRAWRRGRWQPKVACVCGSFYLVAAARRALEGGKKAMTEHTAGGMVGSLGSFGKKP